MSVRSIVDRETWQHHEGSTGITFENEEAIGSTQPSAQTILASFHARKGDVDVERRERASLAAQAPAMARLLLRIGERQRDGTGACDENCDSENCFAFAAREILRRAGVVT